MTGHSPMVFKSTVHAVTCSKNSPTFKPKVTATVLTTCTTNSVLTEQYLLRELAKLAPKFSTLPFEKIYRLENGQSVEGYTTHGDYRDNRNWDFYDPINFGDFITNFESKYSFYEDDEDQFEALKFDNCTQTNCPELFKLIDGCFTGNTLLGRPTEEYELIEYWID